MPTPTGRAHWLLALRVAYRALDAADEAHTLPHAECEEHRRHLLVERHALERLGVIGPSAG